MVSEGKITIDEAERLIAALEKNGSNAGENNGIVQKSTSGKDLKFLRVVVDSTNGDNVNVRVPVALLRAGLKLSALVPPQVYQKVSENMAEKGVNFDINQMLINGDIEQLVESMSDLNVDVNAANGDKVRVFFE
jgi:hypothetical protein